MALKHFISDIPSPVNIPTSWIVGTLLTLWTVHRIGLIIYRLYFHRLAHFPGPWLARCSSLYEMYYDIWDDGTFVWKMDDLHRKYGPIVRTGPEKVRLRKPSAYFEIHRMGTPFIKDIRFYHLFGVSNSAFAAIDPEQHRARRSLVNPSFSRRRIFELESSVVMDKIDKWCRRVVACEKAGELMNLHTSFAALSVDIASEVAFAKSYNVLDTPDFHCRSFTSFETQSEWFYTLKHFPLLSMAMNNCPHWLLVKIFPQGAGFVELLHDAGIELRKFIEEMKTEKKKDPNARRTIYEEMLSVHKNPADANLDEITAEGMSIIAAGVHTTRWSLCIGVLEIALSPEITGKLFSELKTCRPDMNVPFKWIECEQLPYLHGCVMETLRLSYGVMGPLPRRVPKDGAIVGGYELPGDSTIEMDHWSMSHDPDLFPHSQTFMPERWLDPESKKLEKYVVTFGCGPRQCLGINLAYSELYLTIATLFRKFHVDVSHRNGQRMVQKEHWTGVLRGEPLKARITSRVE